MFKNKDIDDNRKIYKTMPIFGSRQLDKWNNDSSSVGTDKRNSLFFHFFCLLRTYAVQIIQIFATIQDNFYNKDI